MSFSTISALSPLDGRYAGRLASLRPLMSEQGFMHRRVQVEITWFIALSDAGFAKRLMAALDSNRGEFERLVSSIVHDQERLAYGG